MRHKYIILPRCVHGILPIPTILRWNSETENNVNRYKFTNICIWTSKPQQCLYSIKSRSIYKRKESEDIANTFENETNNANNEYFKHAMQNTNEDSAEKLNDTHKTPSFDRNYQNVHPLLGWYKHDLQTYHFSYEQF